MSQPVNQKNQLLAALPAKTYGRLLPKLERIGMTFGEQLYNPGDVFSHVYFPESGIISMLAVSDEASSLEVAMIGDDGMAGLPVFLGVKVAVDRAVVQGSGHAFRIKVADFIEECDSQGGMTQIMLGFTYSIILQIDRSAVCNRFHSIESRLARWLLLTQDRMKSSEFRVTQEFLSYMLGVRREAVNKAAKELQRRNLISYVRGTMTIVDRKELESIVCGCYGFIVSKGGRA